VKIFLQSCQEWLLRLQRKLLKRFYEKCHSFNFRLVPKNSERLTKKPHHCAQSSILYLERNIRGKFFFFLEFCSFMFFFDLGRNCFGFLAWFCLQGSWICTPRVDRKFSRNANCFGKIIFDWIFLSRNSANFFSGTKPKTCGLFAKKGRFFKTVLKLVAGTS